MTSETPELSCESCGACCTNMGHPRFRRFAKGAEADPYWRQLPLELQETVNAYVEGLEEIDVGEPCIWLDMETRQCIHYQYRPEMCRAFEKGSFHCHRLRQVQGIEPLA